MRQRSGRLVDGVDGRLDRATEGVERLAGEVVELIRALGQRALSRRGDRDRVEALADQRRLGPEPGRDREPRELGEGRGQRRLRLRLVGDAPRRRSARAASGPLVSVVELLTTYGGRRSLAPGWEIAITASTESRSGRPSSSSRAPAAPAALPLVEASRNVFSRSRLPSASASSTSRPVAAALPAAPGPRAESRAAKTTTVLPASPGSVRSTFRSETSSPSNSAVEALLGDRAGGDLAEALGDQVGDGVVSGAARLALRRQRDHLAGDGRGARRPRAPALRPPRSRPASPRARTSPRPRPAARARTRAGRGGSRSSGVRVGHGGCILPTGNGGGSRLRFPA